MRLTLAFQLHVNTLLAEDSWPYARWQVAVAYFREQVDNGRNIEPAVAALKHAYLRCTAVVVLEQITAILVRHYFRQQNMRALHKLLQDELFASDILAALKKIAATGFTVRPHIHKRMAEISRGIGEPAFVPYRYFFLAYLRQNPDQLLNFTRPFMASSKSRRHLPGFLEQVILADIDVAPAIPSLIKLLTYRYHKKDAVFTLLTAASRDIDFGPWRQDLEPYLRDVNEAVRYSVAFLLGAGFTTKRLWSDMAWLLRRKDRHVRRGALTAMVRRQKEWPAPAPYVTCLVRAVADRSQPVRKLALTTLLAADEKEQRLQPSGDDLREILPALKRKKVAPELVEYLFTVIHRYPEMAEAVQPSLLALKATGPTVDPETVGA